MLLLSNDGGMRFKPADADVLRPRDSTGGLNAPIPGALSATFYDVSDDVSLKILIPVTACALC